ncbi:MAG: septum site-determining protein MinC [Cyanobium sp. Prado107]|jgi:septum site-determining protein MinC|nr:septum site-determining protein MinC [Cyanobium sp. Prado107]
MSAAMNAVVVPPGWDGGPGWLVLPSPEGAATAVELVERALDEASLLADAPLPMGLGLAAAGWQLGVTQLRAVTERLAQSGVTLVALCSDDPRSRVAAAAIGLQTSPPLPQRPAGAQPPGPAGGPGLALQRGTLRSGDHLEVEGSVLVLGDVNPGACVRAGGHVLVWGRLRGIAHAGCQGDTEARIVALQLRPLQLRIADAVARGPEDSPPAGMAEQASLVEGEIRLDPAQPCWPLAARA